MATEPREGIDPFELPPGVKATDLRTLGDVRRELARLYDAMKAKVISAQEGNGMTQTLFTLSKVMSETTLDEMAERLRVIEEARDAH